MTGSCRRPSCLVASLLLISAGLAQAENSQLRNTSSCDRVRSRLARSVVKQYVVPHAKWLKYPIPEECVLHPQRDIFAAHEHAKRHEHQAQWRCGFCDAVVRSESLLDQHLDSHHPHEVNLESDVCLADLCDVLLCDHLATENLWDGKSAFNPYARHAPCVPAKEAELKARCRAIAEPCFASDHKKGPLMWDLFAGHICAAHICDEEARARLLLTVQQSRPHIRWGYSIFAGFVICILLGFYLVFWLYMRLFVGMVNESDIKRISPAANSKSWWPFAKPKQY